MNDFLAIILLLLLFFSCHDCGGTGINVKIDGVSHSFSWGT